MANWRQDWRQDLLGRECNYTSIAFAALLRIPEGMRRALQSLQQWEDLESTVMLSALLSFQLGETPKDAYNRAQREIYQTLRELGWRRVKGGGFTREKNLLE